ncbi:cytochrome P450 monooxygenase [Fusarium heterosporum]|uniref:Cytochrome P450 monooxygenase n=1 Tax=Fusarium heterosporum TaxID=42747 RepID=A0A8H5X2K2_FUSHE|nr:cytochrome P450 monooxygenase [Fusarium heterosporum]
MSSSAEASQRVLRDALQSIIDNPKAVVLTAVIGLVVLYVIDSIRIWYRLSHIPGPFLAGFSTFWMMKESFKGEQPYAFQRANEKYGSLVRVGPNELVTDDAQLLRRMMAARSSYTRGPYNLFSTRDEHAHKKLRNKMAAGYSGKENPSLEWSVDAQISNLVTLLEIRYLSTEKEYRPVDFAEKAQFFTLDVISDLAFGEAFGYLEKDEDVFDFIAITRSYFPVAMIMSSLPMVVDILHSRLFNGLLPKETDKLGFGAFIGVAKKKVAERFEPNAEPRADMMGSFIKNGLSQEQASRESLLNVVAGSDTTATTIRMVMLCLLSNPVAYRKLQEEIDTGIKNRTISSPISDAEARKLPYLQAIIQEGLRIKVPAAGPLFKQVPDGGDYINGKFIPGGTQIGISPFSVYHSKEIFGQDAGIFRPERWLNADPARLEVMSDTAGLVFSSGKWQCIGKPVAIMELNKVFVELFRRFDFSIVQPEKPLNITNAGVWIMENFSVRVTQREW